MLRNYLNALKKPEFDYFYHLKLNPRDASSCNYPNV
jgi:hypothetical protein